MAEQLNEDKLVAKKDSMVKKGVKDGWTLIKIIWMFLRDELPQFLSNWRTVPRLMMVLYGIAFYQTMQWFMALPEPNNAQAGLVSVVVGAGAAWFGLYVNSTSTKHDKPVVVPQQTGSMPTQISASTTTPTATPVAMAVNTNVEDADLPPPVRRI